MMKTRLYAKLKLIFNLILRREKFPRFIFGYIELCGLLLLKVGMGKKISHGIKAEIVR